MDAKDGADREHSSDSRLSGISTSDDSSSEETSSAEKLIRSKALLRDLEGFGFWIVFGLAVLEALEEVALGRFSNSGRKSGWIPLTGLIG